jgi:hypothetical protein
MAIPSMVTGATIGAGKSSRTRGPRCDINHGRQTGYREPPQVGSPARQERRRRTTTPYVLLSRLVRCRWRRANARGRSSDFGGVCGVCVENGPTSTHGISWGTPTRALAKSRAGMEAICGAADWCDGCFSLSRFRRS